MGRFCTKWWFWGVTPPLILLLSLCAVLIAVCHQYRIYCPGGLMVYREMTDECHPVWRDFNFRRIKAGDAVEEVIAKTSPHRVERHGNCVLLSYQEPGGFSGVGAIAYDGRLMFAYASSCGWTKVFFDEMTDEQSVEQFGTQRITRGGWELYPSIGNRRRDDCSLIGGVSESGRSVRVDRSATMTMPGYQEFMLPLLQLAGDGQEHTVPEALTMLANKLSIPEQEQAIMLPSGAQTRYKNRVSWAITYLVKSLLLEKTGRGRFRIAPRGAEVLRSSTSHIDAAFLEQFPEYQALKTKKRVKTDIEAADSPHSDTSANPDITPDEQLEVAYRELRETLADELLTRVRKVSPKFFEQLVVDVLVAMGYGGSRVDAAQVVGKSGDGGIDGVIKEDRLGLDMVYVQAKRHEADIGPGAIREFVGSLGEHRANKGVFITCGGFTSGARDAAAKAHFRIVLIDDEQLAEFMIDHGVGVAAHKTYTVKKLDNDYFEDL